MGYTSSCDTVPELNAFLSNGMEATLHALSATPNDEICPQVEQRAVNLWNLTVSKKTGGSFSHDLNAKLRHVACCLVCACNVRNQDEEASRKKIMMALKTVRAWLDAGDVSLIETPIRIAQQCIEEMRTQLIAQKEERGDSEDLTKKRFALEADLFKLLCYEAEAAVARSSYDLALSLVEQAKSLLEPMPLEGSYLSMLCYNLGLECHQQGEHQSAVVLLRESFEIGKCHQAAAGQKNQARSLRLLATVYLEWDGEKYWKDALNAVNVAQSKHGSSAGLLIKTRALLMGDASDTTLIEGLKELFGHPELTLDVALSALVELGKRSRVTALLESFVDLNQRYSDGSVDLRHRLWACQLELLLQAQRLQEAKTLVEEITSNLRNGSTMEPDMKRRFYGLLWERAAQVYKEAHYAEALEWYNYCLGLNAIQNCSAEMAKLHRNRAACCIASGKLNEATDSLVQAEAFDSVSPFTHFLKFKMAVMQGRVNQATEPIRVMMSFAKSLESSAVTANDLEAKETVNGLLCLSAQIAFEREHHDLAEMALNCVLACNNDPDQQLMGLRCLTRLRLSRAEQSDTPSDQMSHILSYLEKALNILTEAKTSKLNSTQVDALWFSKIAWNIALHWKDDLAQMAKLFICCQKFSSLIIEDAPSLNRQKTCLLLAVAALLEIAKGAGNDALEKQQFLYDAVRHIEECRAVYEQIVRRGHAEDTMTSILLVLYEVEARVRLADGQAEQALERALTLPHAEPKLFETIAALAVESPSNNRSLSIRALKVAIKKHMSADCADLEKCSKCFHSLIQLTMNGSSASDAESLEEASVYFIDAINLVEQNESYPEMQVLWLMTKAWNNGVGLYRGHYTSAGGLKEALKWVELAMRFLKHLGPTLRQNYSPKMQQVKEEMLIKMNSQAE